MTEFGQRLPWLSWQIAVYHALLLWTVKLKGTSAKEKEQELGPKLWTWVLFSETTSYSNSHIGHAKARHLALSLSCILHYPNRLCLPSSFPTSCLLWSGPVSASEPSSHMYCATNFASRKTRSEYPFLFCS